MVWGDGGCSVRVGRGGSRIFEGGQEGGKTFVKNEKLSRGGSTIFNVSLFH